MAGLLADGIDITFVMGIGLAILIPLLAFEVFVEALVLRGVWHQSYGDLCRLTFAANIWSLVAGIPTKILNAWLYSRLLPRELSGFFSHYPLMVALGSFNYFVITVAVEGLYARRWLRKNGQTLHPIGLWKGILLANFATYAVLSPLHYFGTRPMPRFATFIPNTAWTKNATTEVVFVDAKQQLAAVRLDGSKLRTIVPDIVRDYLISTNLDVCLFRGADRALHLYRRGTSHIPAVWQTDEKFHMGQVAFSPSGELVAMAEAEGNYVEVFEPRSGKQVRQILFPRFKDHTPSLAWTTNEWIFCLGGFESNGPVAIKLQADMSMQIDALEPASGFALLPCYGRVGERGWSGSDDWGRRYDEDTCGDFRVWTEPGLGSGLRIYRDADRKPLISIAVNPGLLHISQVGFSDPMFIANCDECLFEADEYLYLLDVPTKRVGTLARGGRWITFSERFRKRL